MEPQKMEILELGRTKYTGEYIMEVTVQPNYPHEPPHFRLLTPNGLYDLNRAPCVVLGHFYGRTSNVGGGSFPSAMGVKGFVEYVVAGFVDPNMELRGTHILRTVDTEIQKLAEESRSFNEENYAQLMEWFSMEKETTRKIQERQKAKQTKPTE